MADSPKVVQAASVGGPVASADPTGLLGVYRIAITGSAQNIAIPVPNPANPYVKSNFGTRFVRVKCVGANDLQYAQGLGAAPTLVKDQVSSPGSESAAAGATLFAGTFDDFLAHPNATHIGWIGTAGATNFVEIYVSETANSRG